jgi:hypothetical protein
VSQAKVQALLGQAGTALATPVEQELHAAPFPPQAVGDAPATQLPDAQQPPLQVWLAEHDVVHTPLDVLQA